MSQTVKTFQDGTEIEGIYLLKSAEVKLTSSTPPKEYFDLVIADKTGEVPAKLWDIAPMDKEFYKAPTLVRIQANVQTYRDKLQLKITRMSLAGEDDGVMIGDFIKAAPEDPEELFYAINHAAEAITDDMLFKIVTAIIHRAADKLGSHPAAKSMHHAFFSGLAYHTVRMLRIGDFLLGDRPFLNGDLLRAGIILHDIAKTEELIAELGVAQDYSTRGKLIGHISLVSNWIVEAAIENNIDVNSGPVMLLQHMVLSHHNLGEWGSPVQPQIPEAVALHYIDQLDAKLQAAEDAISAMNDSEEWSQPVPILERKALYRPKRNAPAEDDYRLPF